MVGGGGVGGLGGGVGAGGALGWVGTGGRDGDGDEEGLRETGEVT